MLQLKYIFISLYQQRQIFLGGGFNDGFLVKVVEQTGVRMTEELFSTQEADTRLVSTTRN